MLVTSGQISVAISSGVVFLFTSLLFLSGYVLQQQTVRSIQAKIHPSSPPPPVPTINPTLAKHFRRPPGHSFYDKYLASNRPKGGWAKAAYVHLVREHVHVCNAVMLFEVLEAQESMAQRVLMYPQEWDQQPSTKTHDTKSQPPSRALQTTRRLLQRAAAKNKVMLQPIPSITSSAGIAGSKDTSWTTEEAYPLTSLLTLFHFNRIIYLPPSGLLLDATPTDLLFTLPMLDHSMLGLSAPSNPYPSSTPNKPPAILLIEPSKQLYGDTTTSLPEGAYPDSEFLALVHTIPAPASSSENPATTLLAETGSLGRAGAEAGAEFNATEFLEQTAYIRIRDAGLPGPEYAVPRSVVMQQEAGSILSQSGQAGSAWEAVHERFREARMDVCGLDLEPYRERSYT